MSTRSGRTIPKVTRFDPSDKKSDNHVKKPKKSSKKKTAVKAAKAGKTAVSKKAKGAKRKASKLNADGTPKEKRPKTAYFLFMDEERPNVKKAYPNFDIKEVASELGKRWKVLPDAKKAKFNAEAKKLSDAFKAKNGGAVPKKSPKKSKK